MKKIVLVRHGQSVWNRDNLFTGWTDVELTEQGVKEAKRAAELLKEEGIVFGKAYTSYLKRAIQTLNIILDEMDLAYIPVEKSWRLNEKHYGNLQGLNKAETTDKYGEKQVLIWRRSYDIAPEPIDRRDKRSVFNDPKYSNIPDVYLPDTESLETCIARALPFWHQVIFPTLMMHDNIIVAAHGNSLRGIVKFLKNMSKQDILSLNIPTGVPYVFEFGDDFSLVKDYFLGDQERVKELMEAVANQAKNK